MESLLSNLVNNFSKGIQEVKCKFGHEDKKCETCGITYKYFNFFLEYKNFNEDLIEYKCLCCKKKYQHKFHKNVREVFFNTYNFLTMITISLFYCCEKVFILMNIWMIGKNLIIFIT